LTVPIADEIKVVGLPRAVPDRRVYSTTKFYDHGLDRLRLIHRVVGGVEGELVGRGFMWEPRMRRGDPVPREHRPAQDYNRNEPKSPRPEKSRVEVCGSGRPRKTEA